MISLAGLNPEQREAASIVEGPLLILAGAGSGKTRTVTYRIAHMIDNLGIDPKSILGISFTNKAAKEMKERVVTLLGRQKSRGCTLSTFHSLGVKILRAEIDKLGYHKKFTIFDSSDQMSIIRESLKAFKGDKKFDRKVIQSKIGMLKNNGVSAEDFSCSEFYDPDEPMDFVVDYCYKFYQEKLEFYNVIDFDDILSLTVKLFQEFPEVARKYSQKFKYIMVDEYQDTNPLQFELIQGLTSCHENLCVVGDDDQSIYGFRGADISNILQFEKDYPKSKVIKLEQNYRSVQPILKLANEVIKENKTRKEKSMWSENSSSDLPLLWKMADTDHEAAVVVDEICKYQSNGGSLADIAILYRSNTQIPPLEEQLRMNEVPYTIIGGQKFYEKKEIKDLIAYLSLIFNKNDEISLRRILNVPNRGIGKATLEKFLEKQKSLENSTCLYDVLVAHSDLVVSKQETIKKFVDLIEDLKQSFKNRPLPEAIALLVEKIKFFEFIEKFYDSSKLAVAKRNDVNVFIDSAERFIKFNQSKDQLKDFLEKLLLQDNQDQEEDEYDDDVRSNEVTLMTLHSSKGLEFERVFLIGVEEETLPHKKTISLGEDISEERRLAYVGITRAKEKLIMTYCKERKIYGKQVPRFKSRFIADKPELFIEQDRNCFGHLSEEETEEYKKNFFDDILAGLDC